MLIIILQQDVELMKNQKSFFDLLNERKNKLNNVIN